MAITFQEKSNLGKNILILLALIALFSAVVFFAWYFLQENVPPSSILSPASTGIDVGILQDSYLAEMDFFPEIKMIEADGLRQNPFVENAVISEENAAPH